MKSEAEVMKMLKSSMRLFAKTGRDKFLDEMFILTEILEMTTKERDDMYNEISEEVNKHE